MRFTVLDTPALGALSGRSFDLGADVVVVHGPNEAGKSTFHAALEIALFGFGVARRDRHPLGTWDPSAPAPSLSAQLSTEDGAELWLRRELRTSAGLLQRGSTEAELDGQPRRPDEPLQELAGLGRDLYRAVYSLTANGAIELKDSVRDQVDSLLAGELGLAGARPLYQVRAELRSSAKALWRPDRHRTQDRALQERIQELRRMRRLAASRDRERREESEELDRLERSLEDLAGEITAAARSHARALCAERARDLEARRAQLVPLRAKALGGQAMQDPVRLEQSVAQLTAGLREPRARLERPPVVLSQSAAGLLQRESEVRLAMDQRRDCETDRRRLRDARQQQREHHAEARAALQGVGLEDDDLDPLPLGTWTADARAWLDADGEARAAWIQAPRRGQPLPAILCAVAGLVLVALHAAHVAGVAGLLGGTLLLALAVGLALAGGPPEARQKTLRAVRPAALDRAVQHWSLDASLSPHAMLRILEGAQLAYEAQEQAAEASQLAIECEDREQARRESWRQLAQELLEPERARGEADALPERLADELERARRLREQALADAAERSTQGARLEERSERLEAERRRLQRIQRALTETFGDELPMDQAFAAWQRQRQETQALAEAELLLQQDPHWPEISAAAEATAGQARGSKAREVPAHRWAERSVELEAAEKQQLARRERLLERREHRQGPSVAEVDEQLRAAQDDSDRARLQHDRLLLLDHLLLLAEQRYRREHQPDVLRRAGEFLAAITAGRYTGLSYPAGDSGPLHVFSAERGIDLPVDQPLSRGIQEQVYLCLRLGTLDHLDSDRECLPLILDEALVHWDPERRAALYPLLSELASRRQIILFTCHPELAEEAERGLGAKRIDLAGSPRAHSDESLQIARTEEEQLPLFGE